MNIRAGLVNTIARALRLKYNPAVVERIVQGDPYAGGVGHFDMYFASAYQGNMWVYTCTKIVAQNIAQLPLEVAKRTTSGGTTSMQLLGPDNFIQDLMLKPNAYQSAFDLKFLTIAYLELTGDVFWLIGRLRNGKAGAVTVLRPTRVTVIPGETSDENFVKGYVYRLGEYEAHIDPADMIHIKYPNPNDDHRGQSTIQAAMDTIEEQSWSQKFAKLFFKNSALPKGGLAVEQKLDDADYARIRKNWNKSHQGVDNANKLAVFEKGMKWTNIGMSQKEMDFIEQRKMTRDDIAAVFGVPPVLVNAYERATYNNSHEQVGFFWHETEIPKTVLVKETLNRDAWKFYGPNAQLSAEASSTFFKFNLSENWALRREALERAKAQVELVTSGVRTANEARTEDDLEPVEWGDKWWRAANIVEWDAPQLGQLSKGNLDALQKGYLLSQGEGPLTVIKGEPIGDTTDIIDSLTKVEDLDRDYRRGEWRAFIIRTDFFEKRFASYVSELMKAQEKEMQRNLRLLANRIKGYTETKRKPTQADIDTILFDLKKAEKITDETSRGIYERMTKAAGDRAFMLAEIPGVFDMTDPNAVTHMLQKQQKFVETVADTTWNKAKLKLAKGIEEGKTINQLSDVISDFMIDRRSDKLTIARTEVIGAMNGGLHDGYEQSGVTTKTWSTSLDGFERDEHRAVDGVTKETSDTFTLFRADGGVDKMRYPGDPVGSAGNVINCRCTLLPGKRRETP